jgi:cytochrome c biogenesis protein CcmG/thiol:disulfide interchange protein DsbE
MSVIRRRAMVAGLLVLGLVASACSGSASDTPMASGSPAINATEAPLLPKITPGLPLFDTGTFDALLEQLKGTPVIVNIWASWCGPCRTEAPMLSDAARRYGDQVQFLGVDIIDKTQAATNFANEFHMPYPSVFDPNGAIRDELGFIGQPDTIFFDAAGNQVKAWSGPLTQQILDTEIQQIMGPAPVS